MPIVTLQTAASADDSWQYGNGTMAALNDANLLFRAHATENDRKWIGARFTGTLPPKGSTINVAYLLVLTYSATYDDVDADIHFEDGASPAQFTTNADDIEGRARTTASETWQATTLGVGWVQSPSIVSPLQEIVDSYTPTALVVIFVPNTGTSNYLRIRAYDQTGNVSGPKLYIDYTSYQPRPSGMASGTTQIY